MEFTVATSDFSHAVQTLAPFFRAYPEDAPRDVLVEIEGSVGHLAAERAGHRIACPFPVSGAASTRSVVVPFRIASGILNIHRNFASSVNRPIATLRIEDRDGRAVFSYESCGASCEVPARGPDATQVPTKATHKVLGEVEPVIFARALSLIANALDVRDLDDSQNVITCVRDHEGIASAVAATGHELVVVQGAGLVAGPRVHVSTVPLLAAFLHRAAGRATVAACDTHVTITDAAGQSFSFPQPVGAGRYDTVPIAPNAASDVCIRVNGQSLMRALVFLTRESRDDVAARATVTPNGKLALHVRESERSQAHTEVSTSFVTEARDLAFRFKPLALLRLFRTYDTETIDLRLTTGGSNAGGGDAVRLLSATETTSDGTLRVQRVATLML